MPLGGRGLLGVLPKLNRRTRRRAPPVSRRCPGAAWLHVACAGRLRAPYSVLGTCFASTRRGTRAPRLARGPSRTEEEQCCGRPGVRAGGGEEQHWGGKGRAGGRQHCACDEGGGGGGGGGWARGKGWKESWAAEVDGAFLVVGVVGVVGATAAASVVGSRARGPAGRAGLAAGDGFTMTKGRCGSPCNAGLGD